MAGEYVKFSRVEPELFGLLVAQPETGKADDTGAAVAFWAFLHGFATLEAAGQFRASGPSGGYEGGGRRCWRGYDFERNGL